MTLPELNPIKTSREHIRAFRGYQHVDTPADGAFYECENLTAVYYPLFGVRAPRVKVRALPQAGGIFAKEKLAWVSGKKLFYDGAEICDVSDAKKQFVSMGAWLLVWPDKIAYSTADGTVKQLEAEYTSAEDVTFTLCSVDGTPYENYYTGTEAPDSTKYTYWLDTSSAPHVLRVYSTATNLWNSVPTTYVRIGCSGLGAGFAAYDAVEISGCKDEQFNTTMIVWEQGDDYIVVTGIIDETFTQTPEQGAVAVARRAPDMEFLTEHENRVWGCSSEKNEIYACKLGDPTNWYCYQGIASDSYAATVGTDGPFTGAATHLGYVLFFKENCIHKVFGTKPSNYQITKVDCRGVQKGSEKSLCVVNETLFYKSPSDVCSYDGSLPAGVSAALGTAQYSSAAAGSAGPVYYISMKDAAGEYSLFTYDTEKGIWCREDGAHASGFALCGGVLHMLDAQGVLWGLNGGAGEPEGKVPFKAVSGPLGIADADRKYYSRLQLRVAVPAAAHLRVAVEYDSCGNFEELARIGPTGLQSVCIPVLLRRCDHIRLKLWGEGGVRLYSIAKIMEQGSEVR